MTAIKVNFKLIQGPYQAPPYKIEPGNRPGELLFFENGYKLYDGRPEAAPDHCMLSDRVAYAKISCGQTTSKRWPGDFLADGSVRKSRTNKGRAAISGLPNSHVQHKNADPLIDSGTETSLPALKYIHFTIHQTSMSTKKSKARFKSFPPRKKKLWSQRLR